MAAPYWIDFEDKSAGCVEAACAAEAKGIAQDVTGKRATQVRPIPYPANPRINEAIHPKYGPCPSFCFDPKKCAGRTACPKPYSCTE